MEAIDLTDMNKAEVLAKLYNSSKPLGHGNATLYPRTNDN